MSEVELFAFQNELRDFVQNEGAAQRAFLDRIWGLPIDQRIEEGFAIRDLKLVEIRENQRLRLATQANDSRFREGDLALLSTGDPRNPLARVAVNSVGDEELELFVWKATPGLADVLVGTSGLQLDIDAFDLEGIYLGALDTLGKSDRGREIILPLLLGKTGPTLNLPEFESNEIRAREAAFDEQQSRAVASALSTDLCWMIHGPPGTGKTRVLAWVIAELLARKERVLVTASTHRTINSLLQAVADRIGDTSSIAKIALHHDKTLKVPQYSAFRECPLADSEEGYVIGATPFATRSRRLGGVEFDWVVIDEASQVTLPLAIMAMLAGKRYIFAGDHKQLPPVSLSRQADEAGETSVFGRLVGRGFDTMLQTTHRLNAPLCTWPGDWFYGGKLIPHPSVAARRFHLASPDGKAWGMPDEIFAPDPALVWVRVPHVGNRTLCGEEAGAVCSILLGLRDAGFSWRNVAVVVPYRRQARAIRQMLGRDLKAHPDRNRLVIDTVERIQGQEREFVLISCTTSDMDLAERLGDFLFLPQRINVAATRARTKCLVLASPELHDFTNLRRLRDKAWALRSLLEAAHPVEYSA